MGHMEGVAEFEPQALGWWFVLEGHTNSFGLQKSTAEAQVREQSRGPV